MSERLKEPASKAGSLAKPGSWVQIPPSPPKLYFSLTYRLSRFPRVDGELLKSRSYRRLVYAPTMLLPLITTEICQGTIDVDARFRRVPFASGVRSMLIIIMLEIE